MLVVALIQKESRNLLQPVFEKPFLVIPLAVFGMSMAQLVFHWSLDFASVVQVATIVTTMPILVVVVDRIINKSPVSAPKIVSGIGRSLESSSCLLTVTWINWNWEGTPLSVLPMLSVVR